MMMMMVMMVMMMVISPMKNRHDELHERERK